MTGAGQTAHILPLTAADDDGLATRAAWLYHAGGLTQSEVAQQLGIGAAKAHRLIARATRAGLVRVLVDGPIGGCLQLEEQLATAHGLNFCRVVPSLDGRRALAIAAAGFLHETLSAGAHAVIGVGHGRTLAAAVDHLPRIPAPGIRFVSLLGGLPRRIAANPFDVIHRLGEKTGADGFLLPVPLFADEAADRAVLIRQRGVAETLALAATATLLFVGIGEVSDTAFLPTAGIVRPDEIAALRAAGAVGEILGSYLDAGGRPVATDLSERVIAAPLGVSRHVVAVAGGAEKVAGIAAILASRTLTGLITDEPTARALLGNPQPRETGGAP